MIAAFAGWLAALGGVARALSVAPTRLGAAASAAHSDAGQPPLAYAAGRREAGGPLPWIVGGSVVVHVLALAWAQGLPGPIRAEVEPALQWVAAIAVDVSLPKEAPPPAAKPEPQVVAPTPDVRPPPPRPLRRLQAASTPTPPAAAPPVAAQVAIAIGGPGTVALPTLPADDGAPARADAPPAASAVAPIQGVADGEGLDWGGYNARLRAKIVQRRRYPAEAQEAGWQGTVTVRAHVARDGSLAQEPEVVRSSGFGALDREALRMVRAAAPFAPLPTGFEGATREVLLPIEFVLEDDDF